MIQCLTLSSLPCVRVSLCVLVNLRYVGGTLWHVAHILEVMVKKMCSELCDLL